MPKNQRERRRVKNEKLRGEITSYDGETLRRRFEILFFLFWLKVTSETKVRSGKPKRSRHSAGYLGGNFGSWLAHAKYAALLLDSPDLKPSNQELMRVIGFQALSRNKKFFINLGNCLSGKINPQLWDQRDIDIAEIVLFHQELSAGSAVRELERRGHRGITEENFRMWKMRLLNAKKEYDAVQADEAYDLARGK
jgi:hypothetical protein